MNEDIYMDFILGNYRNPKNYGRLDDANMVKSGSNPLCGDSITIYLKVEEGLIKDIKFIGQGCAISQASASILTQMVKGKNIKDAKNLKEDDLLKILGIQLSPSRLKCALLSYNVFKDAISAFL